MRFVRLEWADRPCTTSLDHLEEADASHARILDREGDRAVMLRTRLIAM